MALTISLCASRDYSRQLDLFSVRAWLASPGGVLNYSDRLAKLGSDTL